MEKILKSSSKNTENLCLECGLCCDGTLFSHVKFTSKESVLLLKDKTLSPHKNLDFPCSYYENMTCNVYNLRPMQCIQYECTLYKKVASKEIELIEAKVIIERTKQQAQWLLHNAHKDNNTIDINSVSLKYFLEIVYELLIKHLNRHERLKDSEIDYIHTIIKYLKNICQHFKETDLLNRYEELLKQL